jgi:hypothetical protein
MATAIETETPEPEEATPSDSVLLSVSDEARNRDIEAYTQGIPRREICSHLRGEVRNTKPLSNQFLIAT